MQTYLTHPSQRTAGRSTILAIATILVLCGVSLQFATPVEAASDSRSGQVKYTFVWPSESVNVSQYFGKSHRGIDIDGAFDDEVYAAKNGRVLKVGENNVYGKYIVLQHKRWRTVYYHLNSTSVTKKSRVEKGDLIGKMGSTGRSTGSHLHFEIKKHKKVVSKKKNKKRRKWKAVNPMSMVYTVDGAELSL